MEFSGVKAALYHDGKLLMFLRDDKPGLRFANMWDFPGGGREGEETPIECMSRELVEEFGIPLSEGAIIWQKVYPAMHDPSLNAYFMVAHLSQEEMETIQFGEEGQRWEFRSRRFLFARGCCAASKDETAGLFKGWR